jgi:hypothetical protein
MPFKGRNSPRVRLEGTTRLSDGWASDTLMPSEQDNGARVPVRLCLCISSRVVVYGLPGAPRVGDDDGAVRRASLPFEWVASAYTHNT